MPKPGSKDDNKNNGKPKPRPDWLDEGPNEPLELKETPESRRLEDVAPLFRRPARKIKEGTFDEVEEDDGPVCTHCSYSLTGLPVTGTCPECGFRYDKRAPKPKSPRRKLKEHEFFGLTGEQAIKAKMVLVAVLVYGAWFYHWAVGLLGLSGNWSTSGFFMRDAVIAFVVVWAPALGFWVVDIAESRRRLSKFEVVVLGAGVSGAAPILMGPVSMLVGFLVGLVFCLLRLVKVKHNPYVPIRYRCEVCEFPLDGLASHGECPKCTAPYDLVRAEQEEAAGNKKVRHMYCRSCEYELTGLKEKGECPECGTAYNLLDPTMRISIVQLANRRRTLKFLASHGVALLLLLVIGNGVIWQLCAMSQPTQGMSGVAAFIMLTPLVYGAFVWIANRLVFQVFGFAIFKSMLVSLFTSPLISIAAATVPMPGQALPPLFLFPVAVVSSVFFGLLYIRSALNDTR